MGLETPIFKIDAKGKVRIWMINVEDKGTTADIVTTAGLESGEKIVTRVTVYNGKNIGKLNSTTVYEQAVKEALAKLENKLRGEYRLQLDDAGKGELRGGRAPMLAQKFDSSLFQSNSKNLKKLNLENKLIHVQPKLDGNRCLIKISQTTLELRSRKGDLMQSIPHIEEQIKVAYKNAGLTEEIILDGELYTDEFSFNTLNGLLKKQSKSDEQKAMLNKVCYHLYDVMMDIGYKLRYEFIQSFASNNVKIVPSYEVEATDEIIQEKLEVFLSDGYEGLMIRTLETPYENKRSWSLMKNKNFQDSEYQLVDIEEDVRGCAIGAFVMRLNTPSKDRDNKSITHFRVGVSGLSHEESKDILANKNDYIGKMATVEYFGLSEYGVPRFGKLKGFRNDV